MKKIKFILAALFISTAMYAQVGIQTNTPDPNSDLTLGSTNKGLRLNKVALTGTKDATTVGAHTAGMTVYNTATAGSGTTAVTPGEYYNDGTQWIKKAGTTATFNPTQNVFVNGADPNSATQFDDVNYYDNAACPAVNAAFTHDATLMALSDALYIGQSACDADGDGAEYSYWIYDGTQYIPYNAPESTEWYLAPSTVDAGSNKTAIIHRPGYVIIGDAKPINKGYGLSVFTNTSLTPTTGTSLAAIFSTNNKGTGSQRTQGINVSAQNNSADATASELIGIVTATINNTATKYSVFRGISNGITNAANAGAFASGYGIITGFTNNSTSTDAINIMYGASISNVNNGSSNITNQVGLALANSTGNTATAGIPNNMYGLYSDNSLKTLKVGTSSIYHGAAILNSNASAVSPNNQIGLQITQTNSGAGLPNVLLRGISNSISSASTGTGTTPNVNLSYNILSHSSTTNTITNINGDFTSVSLSGRATGTIAGTMTTVSGGSTLGQTINTMFSINSLLSINSTSTDNVTNSYGFYTRNDFSSSGLVSNFYGALVYSRNFSINTGNVATHRGLYVEALNSSANSYTERHGAYINNQNTSASTGNVIDNYGINIYNYNAGTGTVTNNYGIYLNNTNSANITNNYSIYSTYGNAVFKNANLSLHNSTPGTVTSPVFTYLNFEGYNNQAQGFVGSGNQSGNTQVSILTFGARDNSGVVNENMRIDGRFGNVGIGTTAPTEKLEVNGAVKVGTTTSTCNAAAAGTIRWTGSAFEKCNGTAWSAF